MTDRSLQAVFELQDLDELGKVEADEVYYAMVQANIPDRFRRDVINRLINNKNCAEECVTGKTIRAEFLLIKGFEKMARVEFSVDGEDFAGHLIDVKAVTNSTRFMIITLRAGQNIETTVMTPRRAHVKIWPVEYKDPSPALQAAGMRPRPPFPGVNPFLQRPVQRLTNGESTSIPLHRRGNFPVEYKLVDAQYLWDFRQEYLGRRVSVPNTVSSFGELTDISMEGNGKVYCIIAGKLYKFNRRAAIRVHPKEV